MRYKPIKNTKEKLLETDIQIHYMEANLVGKDGPTVGTKEHEL